MDCKRKKYFVSFSDQLLNGINYYRKMVQSCNGFSEHNIEEFNNHLDKAELELEALGIVDPITTELN
jgi:hypothetical protein